MNDPKLKALVEMACADGDLSQEEMQQLLAKAREAGLPEDELHRMVHQELKRGREGASGFTSLDADEGSATDSGFGELKRPPKNAGELPQKLGLDFSEVSTLDEQGRMSLIQKGKKEGKWFIIKRMRPDLTPNPTYRQLFFREFENAYYFEHPHIVRIYGRGQDAAGEYYFMEHIHGQKLGRLVTKDGIKSGVFLKKIALEILDALEYVHKQQIWHRDLKPDNIMVTFNGDNVKLIDFGLAAADSYDELLQHAGTPMYAAPELRRDASQANQRADIYSFGLILLEMLAGSPSALEMGLRRSPTYARVAQKCASEDPKDRFQNVREIREKLNDVEVDDLQPKLYLPTPELDLGSIPLGVELSTHFVVENIGTVDGLEWKVKEIDPALAHTTSKDKLFLKLKPMTLGQAKWKARLAGNGGEHDVMLKAFVYDEAAEKRRRSILTWIVVAAILLGASGILWVVKNYDPSLENIEATGRMTFQGQLDGKLARLLVFDIHEENPQSTRFKYTLQGMGDAHKNKDGAFDQEGGGVVVRFETIGAGDQVNKQDGSVMIISKDGNSHDWTFNRID